MEKENENQESSKGIKHFKKQLLSIEYMKVMDEMLAKDEAGQIEFVSWQEIQKEFGL